MNIQNQKWMSCTENSRDLFLYYSGSDYVTLETMLNKVQLSDIKKNTRQPKTIDLTEDLIHFHKTLVPNGQNPVYPTQPPGMSTIKYYWLKASYDIQHGTGT